MNKLIAVVGMAGSGKSIATDYLEKKGWTKIYFGGVIYDNMRKEGIEITPESQKEYRENNKEITKEFIRELEKENELLKKQNRYLKNLRK